MPLRVQCPTCKFVMMVPDNAQGKQARCPNGKCGQLVIVPVLPAELAIANPNAKRRAPVAPPLQAVKAPVPPPPSAVNPAASSPGPVPAPHGIKQSSPAIADSGEVVSGE